MKQEDKDLLLKDLCARLPYGVFCEGIIEDIDIDTDRYYDRKVKGVLSNIHHYKSDYVTIGLVNECELETIKPYLFPLSSMTDEQEEEYNNLNGYELGCFPHTEEALDYLIKNHFDYRGLIPKGLAINATGLNIY